MIPYQPSLLHKTALVGGSTQGIGKSIALAFAEQGANVILLARDEDKLKQTVQELPVEFDNKHHYLVADFSMPNKVEQVVSEFVKHYGPIHILVNNTGGPPSGPITEANENHFLAAFQSHLICNHLLSKSLIPGMESSGYGRIINIVSTSVKIPLPNLGVSNTIRGAVASWSKTLANELAHKHITVNNILPGATMTSRLQAILQAKSQKTGKSIEEVAQEMMSEIPMKRFGKAEEIAALALFLAGPSAAYITGTSIPVDGGRTGTI